MGEADEVEQATAHRGRSARGGLRVEQRLLRAFHGGAGAAARSVSGQQHRQAVEILGGAAGQAADAFHLPGVRRLVALVLIGQERIHDLRTWGADITEDVIPAKAGIHLQLVFELLMYNENQDQSG